MILNTNTGGRLHGEGDPKSVRLGDRIAELITLLTNAPYQRKHSLPRVKEKLREEMTVAFEARIARETLELEDALEQWRSFNECWSLM